VFNEKRWVTALGRTMQEYMKRIESNAPVAFHDFSGRTFKYAAQLGAAGSHVRVRLSNELENQDLVIGDAAIQIEGKPETLTPLSWGGMKRAVATAGAPLLSDAVALRVEVNQRVIISLYFPERYVPEHADASTAVQGAWPNGNTRTNAAYTAVGNFVVQSAVEPTPTTFNPVVSGVEVLTREPWKSVIVLGASRAAGFESWPYKLVRRAAASRIAVANISQPATGLYRAPYGQNELARFDRDVLARPNVTHVILQTGGDDVVWAGLSMENVDHIGGRLTPEPVGDFDLIVVGYRQLIARAHAHGIKVIGTTLHPFKGASYDTNPKRQQRRDEVNTWIRQSGEFDAVIDFDALTHAANDPSMLRTEYDSGNHITLNALGNQAVADAIDLKLFR
jgi:hypothetical protein